MGRQHGINLNLNGNVEVLTYEKSGHNFFFKSFLFKLKALGIFFTFCFSFKRSLPQNCLEQDRIADKFTVNIQGPGKQMVTVAGSWYSFGFSFPKWRNHSLKTVIFVIFLTKYLDRVFVKKKTWKMGMKIE